MEKNMDRLFKKAESGAILFWEVGVRETQDYPEVVVRFGQLGSENIQETSDTIKEGKNIGKANETTILGQAKLKAKQLYDKKVKSGYVASLELAEKGINELEGIKPMLAKKFEECMSKLTWPVYTQPKLDGMRCVAICTNGKVRLFTRTQKEIHSVPHIVVELEAQVQYMGDNWILDGEIYNHSLRNEFEKLMSLARKDTPCDEAQVLQYWVYDVVMDGNFSERNEYISDRIRANGTLIVVPTILAKDLGKVADVKFINLMLGYEGTMVRLDGPYENKRSNNLLKVKDFLDDEFLIVGYNEGNGKLQGHVGSFICKTKDGKEFNAKMDGETAKLKELHDNFDEMCMGRLLNVTYFELTNDGVPRFPVGRYIRD